MASSLKADPQILRLPDTQNEGSIHIKFQNEFPGYKLKLWQRPAGVGARWMEVDFAMHPSYEPDPRGDNYGGSYFQLISKGQALEFVMYHDAQDPNVNGEDPPPDARLMIAAVGEPSNLYTDPDGAIWGGTYIKWSVQTTTPTVAILEVNSQPPVEINSSPGLYKFANGPDVGAIQNDEYQSSYLMALASENFLPGNTYYALLHLVDETGRWQTLQQEFKLKQRIITIHPNIIHILSANDDGDGRAYFDIRIAQRNGQGHLNNGADEIAHYHVPQQEVSNGQNINILGYNPTTIGPYIVNTYTRHVAVLIRGILKQDFDSDVPAGNFNPGPNIVDGGWNQDANLNFVVGEEETMIVEEGFTRAYALVSQEHWQFNFKFFYDVLYKDVP